MLNPQTIPSGQLMLDYRETLLALGGDRDNTDLSRRADLLEEEINRRIAW